MLFNKKDIDLILSKECKVLTIRIASFKDGIKQFDILPSAISQLSLSDIRIFRKASYQSPPFSIVRSFIDPLRSWPTLMVIAREKDDNFRSLISDSKNSEWADIAYRTTNIHDVFSDTNKISTDIEANIRSEIMIALDNIGIKCVSSYHCDQKMHEIITIKSSSKLQLLDDLFVCQYIIHNIYASFAKKIVDDTLILQIESVKNSISLSYQNNIYKIISDL